MTALVVAHRGASHDFPELTLAAYEAAIAISADGLECDVRLTKDAQLVCVHDRTIDRTSDGTGLVAATTLDELRGLDFGTGRGSVLELEQLLSLAHDAPYPVKVLIETKHPSRYWGLVEKLLVEALERHGWAGRTEPPYSRRVPADPDSRVIVMSFAPSAVRRMKLLAPDLPTVQLMHRWRGRSSGRLPAGVPTAGPGLHLLRGKPEYVARAHERGHQVFCWTADEPADWELLTGLGVDAIITNRPAELRAFLAR